MKKQKSESRKAVEFLALMFFGMAVSIVIFISLVSAFLSSDLKKDIFLSSDISSSNFTFEGNLTITANLTITELRCNPIKLTVEETEDYVRAWVENECPYFYDFVEIHTRYKNLENNSWELPNEEFSTELVMQTGDCWRYYYFGDVPIGIVPVECRKFLMASALFVM